MAHNGNRVSHEGTPYAMSYGSQHSHAHGQAMSQPHPYPGMPHSQPSQNGGIQSPYKSFNDSPYSNGMRSFNEKPQIYTAVYSGVQVYEMEVNGVACMRRRNDGWLNATQILKVAGIEKGKRTKVLEKEILTGEHEKVQGGYGKYQGTWISYHRGREFCRQYQVEDALLPLLEYDLNGDGTGVGSQSTETPTKEQAMAANRKRLYNSSIGDRNGIQANQSTFFQNISPTSQMALSAMQKVARFNSPARPQSHLRRSSVQSQSMQQDSPFADPSADSGYNTQGNMYRQSGQEPPRKRMRQSDAPAIVVDASMMSMDPTEPGDSFLYGSQPFMDSHGERDELSTDQALPSPATPEDEEKKALLLDLFADPSQSDYTSHPAFTQLSPHDLSIPLDASANTALHWATTLSRITLLRMLIQKGANIYRGNVAGHSALISAVLVNNCWERSTFPEVLELLSPLIEIRDHQGRTILHHIAVSCGIKGRAPSSKYYLEALLEFLVRSVKGQPSDRLGREGSDGQDRPKQATLMSFLTNIVNAKDKLGNTALNLVARIGNRSIIQQLLEIKADPNIPNYKGVSARDFGVGVEDAEPGVLQPRSHLLNGSVPTSASATFTNPSNIDPAISQSPSATIPDSTETSLQQQAEAAAAQAAITEDQNQDVISSLTTMLTQNFTQHKTLLSQKAAQIDRLNTEIRDLSNLQKAEADAFAALQQRAKTRSDRVVKVANLQRLVEDRRRQNGGRTQAKKIAVGEAEQHVPSLSSIMDAARKLPTSSTGNDSLHFASHSDAGQLLASFSTSDLRALVAAYEANNDNLASVSAGLQKRSNQLELLYRKVVSLCTGVPEDTVEESLPQLVAAVESERGGLGREEAGRVREFLIKVEGVGKSQEDHGVNGGSGMGGTDEDELQTPRMGDMALHRGLMGPPELPV